MIRVSALYPNRPGARFDMDYYAGPHMALVHQCMDSHGLRAITIDRGLAGKASGAPAPYVCVAVLTFDSLEGYKTAFKTHAAALLGDVPNFTDLEPDVQISEVVL